MFNKKLFKYIAQFPVYKEVRIIRKVLLNDYKIVSTNTRNTLIDAEVKITVYYDIIKHRKYCNNNLTLKYNIIYPCIDTYGDKSYKGILPFILKELHKNVINTLNKLYSKYNNNHYIIQGILKEENIIYAPVN